MAGSVNKVIIVGNLGRDPEVRTFQNGGKVVNLRVATSESWRDKQSGERKERTEWHSVTIHAEGAAKFAEQYLHKGSTVYIEGQLETRKWQDQSGADRYSTEVVIRPYSGTLQGISGYGDGERGERRERGDRSSGGARYDQSPDRGQAGGGGGYGGGGRPGGNSDLNDEIPFAPEVR